MTIKFFTKGKTLSRDEATALVKRFFDGDTSLADEEKLYKYFATGKVNSSLKQYAPMFGWYANELQTPVKKHTHNWRYIAAAAVAMGVIATVGIRNYNAATSLTDEEQRLAEIYAGSYIVRNGVKITNMKEVLPAIMQREKERKDMRERFAELTPPKIDVRQRAIEEMFGDIEDDYVRNELIKIYSENN
jgi:IS5 family transposase